ncbi:MAG: MATE family efflux transporter [Ruminococcaceae bacterium]|nr:MATE family efflux transporter [Oscillospiraceae bacterium]
MSKPLQENKMGVMPVGKLLFSMALPMIISMLVQAMYNIVDSIFVAQLSEKALNAVTIAFPIQNLMIAVGAGTGVGVNALLSRSLGEGNHKEANRAANNAIFLYGLSYIVFLLFGLLGTKFFIQTQTNDVETIGYGVSYLSLCCSLSFGLFGQFVFERLLQSTGKTLYTMITQGTGAIINIILDPLFIFGIGDFEGFGVAGAAIATVFGQIVAMLLAIRFNRTKNKEIHITLRGFRPNLKTIRKIYAVGIPSIIMGSIASVMTFFFNRILLGFGYPIGDAGVTVLGTYFKLQSFIFMPVFGLNNGMVPIVAYNYGAKNPERISKTIRLSIISAVSMMLVGLALFQLFPHVLLAPFNLSETTVEIAVTALRTISLSFLFAGFCIIVTSVFQALSHGLLSLTVSVGRQLVVLIPVAYLLSLTENIHAVWWAFPIAEVMSLALSTVFFVYLYKKEIKPLSDQRSA